MPNTMKPVELKILEGNPGKRPLPKINKPSPGMPKCPSRLSDKAKTWWRSVVPALDRIGMLSKVDSGALEAAATSYGNMANAIEKINKFGAVMLTNNDNYIVSPHHTVYKQNAELYHKFCSEFGLTPNARQKIAINVENDEDAFDSILK